MASYALFKTYTVLIVGIFSGYLFQKLSDKKKWLTEKSKRQISIFLQKFAMLGLLSITYIGSLWVYKIENISKVITIPFVGMIPVLAGGFLAMNFAKYRGYSRVDVGSMFSCGYFSNHTSLGAMICFFYFGEVGFALVPIFTFFERLLYFGLGYPIANIYSKDKNMVKKGKPILKIIEVIMDPFFYIGVGSIVIGFLLNISSLQRPVIFGQINEVVIPLNTYILLFSIGITFKFRQVFKYLKECFYISFIKFFLVPLITLVVAFSLGYHETNLGLLLKVTLVLSAMPVAFNSVIAANIYNLNIDLVNSCWIFTTLSTIIILPLLEMFIGIF